MTTHNDTPNPCLPHSKPKPLTPHRSTIHPLNNIRPNYMIPLQLNNLTNARPNNKHTHNISMMTRCYPREYLSRTSYSNCSNRSSLWNNSLHYFRSLILYWIFLRILSLKSCPYTRTRRLLTPSRHSPLNPLEVPLLNTSVLLASGVSITWAHHSLIEGNRNHILQALFITIALGVYFTLLQASEYYEAPFTISDAVYGSIFFVATGFHGLHVIIRSTFLIVCFFRQLKFHFTSSHHFGFEAAAWYWHFVDVVWLFLYVSIYWWGSCPFSINQYDWLPISQLVSFGPIWKRTINLIIALLTNLTVATLLVTITFWLPQLNVYSEKTGPYECGFDPMGSARLPLSIRFVSGGHHIPPIWPRNCTTPATTVSLTNS